MGKIGILLTILFLVFIFWVVISLGAGAFKKGKVRPETKRYLKSVNILLLLIALFGSVMVLFL